MFIPQTAQQLVPLGLLNYFPAIVPKLNARAEVAVPDEVALVVYPSQTVYERAQSSVAGKAYGALHGIAFNFNRDLIIPSSTSDAPEPWSDTIVFDKSYSVLETDIDWSQGSTAVLLAKPKNTFSCDAFRRAVENTVCEWRARQNESLNTVDAAIVCINKNWLLCWEHRLTSAADAHDEKSLIFALQRVLESPILLANARPVCVPPAFSFDDDGVECENGELLSVYVRRV